MTTPQLHCIALHGIVEQEMVLRKLKWAHEQMQKEQLDVSAMHEHTSKGAQSPKGDQPSQGPLDPTGAGWATFHNPLEKE